jgi:hypothetical protein
VLEVFDSYYVIGRSYLGNLRCLKGESAGKNFLYLVSMMVKKKYFKCPLTQIFIKLHCLLDVLLLLRFLVLFIVNWFFMVYCCKKNFFNLK